MTAPEVTGPLADTEIVDGAAGVVLRRVVVGVLDTNCWILTTTSRPETGRRPAIVVDPGDEPERIIDAAHDLSVSGVILTHAHFDHVLALPTVNDAWGCPVHAHPDDGVVWPNELAHLTRHGHFDAGTATADLLAAGCPPVLDPEQPRWSGSSKPVADGDRFRIGDRELAALHTPGHTPGGLSLTYGPHLLSGDTLFPGGPGLTGPAFSDFETIVGSIRDRLFLLPDPMQVHPGHGRSTTIGAERPHLDEWVARGW